MSEQTQSVRNHVVEKMNAELFAKLRGVPILSSLKDDELHCIEGVQEIYLDKDELLVHQGEAAHFFWILLDGEFRIEQSVGEEREVMLGKIEAGNAFGELPLLANIPNAASVRATA